MLDENKSATGTPHPPVDHAEADKYFETQAAYWLAYHNHKENSAWAVLVIFAAVALGVGKASEYISVKPILVLIVLVISLVFGGYLLRQLLMREKASRRLDACQTWRSRIKNFKQPQGPRDLPDSAEWLRDEEKERRGSPDRDDRQEPQLSPLPHCLNDPPESISLRRSKRELRIMAGFAWVALSALAVSQSLTDPRSPGKDPTTPTTGTSHPATAPGSSGPAETTQPG